MYGCIKNILNIYRIKPFPGASIGISPCNRVSVSIGFI